MSRRAAFLTLALALVAPTAVAAAETPRAVVELFTSQGCSASPPADALLAELAQDPAVVALTLPVTYWDYLGWKDTLAEAAFSARQRAYAAARGDGQIYTPQIVVNGLAHVVGSDRNAIEESAVATRGRLGALSVSITLDETPTALKVEVGAAPDGVQKSGTLWLLPVVKKRAVSIHEGENKDLRVTYTNVVRRIVRMAEWKGEPLAFEMPIAMARPAWAEGYVIILQSNGGGAVGPILGAAKGPGL
ncbi:DUF1223 domain-containing protein [Chelatococcus sp. SYSU_G07232]|uniref:DUF1223 domain-containing protein n=1 Tax=Chelatococcus albus TaxID=3047466 RepID=A0ABT7AKW8_9HYPH|nr:DUF1223 domain-containing protein [Chelatococcus sp. SYSU_G07232]MDJ1159745.1 DUF1223 domain-containing protein [Chelatococcus sp. SYSU_G07232]